MIELPPIICFLLLYYLCNRWHRRFGVLQLTQLGRYFDVKAEQTSFDLEFLALQYFKELNILFETICLYIF
jgi:hypothetical protein